MAASTSVDRNDDTPLPPEESLPRKDSNPLLWLLLLLAVLAAIWFLYNRSASNVAVAPATTSPIIAGDSQQAAAQAERGHADAAAARKTQNAHAVTRAAAAKPRTADRGAEPMAAIRPTYPTDALRAREEGVVRVRADIDANGVPNNVTVASRSGSRDLDRAAMDAVRQAHFSPAIRDGKAVASTIEVPVDFKLSEQ